MSIESCGLDLTSSGKVHVDADVDFELDFTFDLASLGDPKFIIYDDSQITFNTLKIETLEPIDVTGSLLVGGEKILSLRINQANLDVDLTGTISLVEDPIDQRYEFGELASDLSLWNIDLLGSVDANLPLYFPTEEMPLGGTEDDLNADGFADNVLHFDGEFRGDNEFDVNFAVAIARKRLGSGLGTLAAPALALGLRLRFGDEPKPPQDVALRPVSDFGPDYDALWERARGSYTMCVRRDAAYLRWKYVDCPHVRYDLLEARRDGTLRGFAVSRVAAHEGLKLGWILDLFTAADDDPARDALVSALLAGFQRAGVARAQAFAMSASLQAGLLRRGFMRGSSPMSITR